MEEAATTLLPAGIDILGLIDLIKEILLKIVDLFGIFPLNIFFGATLVGLGIMFFKRLKAAASGR